MDILYIYDSDGWAVHEVGKLWLKGLVKHKVTFKKVWDVTKQDIDNNDFIWYGYARLYSMTFQADLDKSIFTVHDPKEFYTPHKFWKSSSVPLSLNYKIWYEFFFRSRLRKSNLQLIKKAKHVVVISREMQTELEKNGVESTLINTTSNFPIENASQKDSLSIVSVANSHIRKNFSLLKKIQKFCNSESIHFEFKGREQYSKEDYIKFMDKHNVYLCTSFQEGGPLPPMELMARGGIVLTTPVGQIQELVVNGKNGFICENYNDFVNKIIYLKENKDVIKEMSNESIRTVEARHPLKIQKIVEGYLEGLESKKWQDKLENRDIKKHKESKNKETRRSGSGELVQEASSIQ